MTRNPQGPGSRDHPLVSIVTPTLNRATLLEQTLRSVRDQTYPHIEHIVMDGGSTDATRAVLEAFSPTYRLRWESGPDASMYDALNRGFAQANGDIVAYLNSDDLYLPWTISTVVEAFRRRPDADFVFGDALNVNDETGMVTVIWQPPFRVDDIQRVTFLVQPTVFWRRRVMPLSGPFDPSLRYVADCDFWMRAGLSHRFAKVDEFLAIERDHGTTLRATQRPALLAELDAVRRRYVSMEGSEHRRKIADFARRMRWYRRACWLRFVLTSLAPSPLRRGPWANAIRSDLLRYSRVGVLVAQLPRVGRRLGNSLVEPGPGLIVPWQGADSRVD